MPLCAQLAALGRRTRNLALALGLISAASVGLGLAAPATAQAASNDGWISAIDAARGEKPRSAPHVLVDIVSERDALTPQAENRLAVRFTHENEWHTYWKEPGDAGLPPIFTFSAPANVTVSAPLFPLPERTITSGIITFGYGGETLFPFTLTMPRGASGEITLSLNVDYLACRDMCVPEVANVKKTFRIDVAGKPTSDAAAIEAALRNVPEAVPADGSISAKIEGDRIRIDFNGTAAVQKTLDFLPSQKNVIQLSVEPVTALGAVKPPLTGKETSSEQPAQSSAAAATASPAPAASKGASLWLKANERFAKSPSSELKGVLVADGGPAKGGWAVETTIPLEAGTVAPPPENPLSAPAAEGEDAHISVTTGAALLFAFLGGLILNLMPCVFPVLSLKLLDLIEGAQKSEKLVRHGAAFTAGVLVSMLVLSGVLMALRAAGHAVGWGFQLQSPAVVAALILLFGAISCNLLGLYEVTFGSRAADAKVLRETSSSNPLSSFFSGILAVIVASPCTAPFMGAGIGYALTQPALEAVLVFVALGLGMSAPWFLLCLFPGWAKCLPRPGAWMVTLRKVMAIPMLLALLWLGWVLSKQVDYRGVLTVVCGLASLAVFCWLLGRKQFGKSTSVPVMGLLGVIAAGSVVVAAMGTFDRQSVSAEEGWKLWSPAAVETALGEGKPVFVDFTAAWCITCQANKLAALDRNEVVSKMNELGYVRLLADWTNKDPAITAELAKFGRTGVPLYVIYEPGGKTTVLPELLTPSTVLDALK